MKLLIIYFFLSLFFDVTLHCQPTNPETGINKTAVPVSGIKAGARHIFKKVCITDEFWCEGANFGDFNHDGKKDICGGPFWWEGPAFRVRHTFRSGSDKISKTKNGGGSETVFSGYSGAKGQINDYSDNFLTYVADFNHDGWDDILVYGFPGTDAFWYQNPKGGKNREGIGLWIPHKAITALENESPTFGDINGDKKPEGICNSRGYLGYATPDRCNSLQPWVWHSISPKGQWQKFTHGMGFGDINGDGRADFLEPAGWWEQPVSLSGDPIWKFHNFSFTPGTGTAGGAQMLVYDFNGDGMNDVLTTLNPHSYGLVWYEQSRTKGEISFTMHTITGRRFEDNNYGVRFSQAHALALSDIDGDGLRDIVTGKRFWAHGPEGDDEPNAPSVLYWFKTVRHPDHTTDFIPFLIDNNSGVGTQVVSGDVTGDGMPDIIVGNKKGIFLFINELKK